MKVGLETSFLQPNILKDLDDDESLFINTWVERNSMGPTNQKLSTINKNTNTIDKNITMIDRDSSTVDNNINTGNCLVCSEENDEKWFNVQIVMTKCMLVAEYV